MAKATLVEIPVTPEAAAASTDPERRRRIGAFVNPASPEDNPLAAIFAETKAAARADGMTDANIDAELTAYNAERRI